MTSKHSRSKPTYNGLWVPDLSAPSHILPHTHAAGDAFYIGDVYEPSRIGPSGELIDKHRLSLKSPTPCVS